MVEVVKFKLYEPTLRARQSTFSLSAETGVRFGTQPRATHSPEVVLCLSGSRLSRRSAVLLS